jgi:hypothetical protein
VGVKKITAGRVSLKKMRRKRIIKRRGLTVMKGGLDWQTVAMRWMLVILFVVMSAVYAVAAMTVEDIESVVKPGESIEMSHAELLKAVTGAQGQAQVLIVGPGAAGARGSLQLTADRVIFTAPTEESTVEIFFVVKDDVERVKGRWIIKVVKESGNKPAA